MKNIIIILVALLFPAMLHAQQGYLDVTAPGNRQLQLAICTPKSLAGQQSSDISKTVSDVLQFDMTLAGPFSVRSVADGSLSSGIRPGEFDFAPWKSAGVDLLV
ncbi:MAG TPA: Tol-Pal system beta propeller repeat protein TolB, partial [Geobacteraceae bacterium]